LAKITRPATAFQKPTQRRKRQKAPNHLKFIRSLPCLVCATTNSEAAHIRFADRTVGKRETGMGEKPDDTFCVPLCEECHRTGSNSQHSMGEAKFWHWHYIDVTKVALALWTATGDYERGLMIVEANQRTPKI
jgi:5-methylcytosine-specific restriction endonuclease McrA